MDRAAALVAQCRAEVFDLLRNRAGPFVFMDTYVFVMDPDGSELVNPAFPSLEDRNLLELRDVRRGRALVQEEIAAARKDGRAWVDGFFYQPHDNAPPRKLTCVRNAQFGTEIFMVGWGFYVE